MNMLSLVLLLCALLTVPSSTQAKGTKPRDDFECRSHNERKRIDILIETGSELFAGTNDYIRLFLRDSHGVPCGVADLNNPGDDHERNSLDQYAICCPSNFAETDDLLSLLLIGHRQAQKGGSDDWFIERIEVRSKGFVLLEYRFHAWTNPFYLTMFGVSKMESSRSKTKTPSYFLIRG